ncbi:unnamed protein product [Calypogeia fissa]
MVREEKNEIQRSKWNGGREQVEMMRRVDVEEQKKEKEGRGDWEGKGLRISRAFFHRGRRSLFASVSQYCGGGGGGG